MVPTGIWNASVPFSPFSCKELGVGFAIHLSLGEKHLSWVDINLPLREWGKFPVVRLLRGGGGGDDANTNPELNS